MNYMDIKVNDVAQTDGLAVSLWVSGCEFHCSGCFNTETWSKNNGKPFGANEEGLILNALEKNGIKRKFAILGGDPFAPYNRCEVNRVMDLVKVCSYNTEIWVWTGYTYEEILEDFPYALEHVDVLVDGRFEQDKRDLMLKHRGSSNQRVIDVQKSLKYNKIILRKE